MKRMLLVPVMAFVLTTASLAEDFLPLVMSSELPVTGHTKPNYDDDRDYEGFVGRLYIDEIDIDVALYHSNSQEVVDRKDSAAYFDLSSARGDMIIADHNTHSFGALCTVKKGAIARLVNDNGVMEYYECAAVFKGHNTGKGITDWSGRSVVGAADLMMYTCFDGWQNVWVVLWQKTLSPEEQEKQSLLHRFGASMDAIIHSLLMDTKRPSISSEENEELELTLLNSTKHK